MFWTWITWRNQGKHPSFGFLGTFYDILEEIENVAKQNVDVQGNLEMVEANQLYPEEGVRLLDEMRNLSVFFHYKYYCVEDGRRGDVFWLLYLISFTIFLYNRYCLFKKQRSVQIL